MRSAANNCRFILNSLGKHGSDHFAQRKNASNKLGSPTQKLWWLFSEKIHRCNWPHEPSTNHIDSFVICMICLWPSRCFLTFLFLWSESPHTLSEDVRELLKSRWEHRQDPASGWLSVPHSACAIVPSFPIPSMGRLYIYLLIDPIKIKNSCWLVVSTHWKNINQNENLPQVGVKIKNIANHHPEMALWNGCPWGEKPLFQWNVYGPLLIIRPCISRAGKRGIRMHSADNYPLDSYRCFWMIEINRP